MNRNPISIAILADMPRGAAGVASLGRGGGHFATWLPQLAETLSAEKDLLISWLTLDSGVYRVEVDEALGQRFYRIPKGKMTWDLLCNHFFARRNLLSVLKMVQPDVIHVWGSETSYPSVLDHVTVPTILSMQGMLSHYREIGGLPGGWRAQKLANAEPLYVRNATVVTSESQWGLDKVRALHPQAKTRQVEYGAHPSFYELKWDPNPNEPALLFCGSLDWRKGVDLLIEALASPPARSWKCWIAGDGPLKSVGEARNLPGVEWLGNLKWDELQHRMTKAWGLVLPTRADTSPNVVKEARVMGLPVITSLHGGQSEYIYHNKNGLIVDPLNIKNLRAAMDLLASDYAKARTFGAIRHEEDRAYFRAEKTAEGFMAIYRELTSKGRKPKGEVT